MATTEELTGSHTQDSTRSSRWIRPRQDRIVAGVAVGIANETGLSLGLIRTAFVILAIFGGIGLGAYVLGWVLMRSEDADASVVDAVVDRIDAAETPQAKVGVLLMVAAGLVVLGAVGVFSAPVLIAGLLFAVGVKLIER